MILETIWSLLFIGLGLFAGGVAFNEHRRLEGHAASQNLPLYHMVAGLLIYIGLCFVWSETVGRAAAWLDRVLPEPGTLIHDGSIVALLLALAGGLYWMLGTVIGFAVRDTPKGVSA